MSSAVPRTIARLVAVLLLSAVAAGADEIKVLTSGAFTAALQELAPRFERETGHTVVIGATSSGVGANSIASRLQRGEPIDVVIVADAALDEFIKAGSVRAGSRVDLVRSAIGVAVRAGAPKPEIGSADALKRALLQAKSIAYSASVSGTYLTAELFPRLGIADEIRGKSRRIEGERVGAVVARGEADIGFQQISELLPVPGIEYLGPLPSEVQRVTVFAAGVGATASNPGTARTLIAFLASPAAASAITKSGLEQVVLAPR